jgi:hypothetical protein
MTLSQALQTIRKHWKVLPHERKESHEAVWMRIPPTDELSEVEEEWVGMRSDGSLVWAYASGYASREGNPETASLKEVKVWQFDRKDMPKQWKAAIITFANTSCDHKVEHRDHCVRGRQEAEQAREQIKDRMLPTVSGRRAGSCSTAP